MSAVAFMLRCRIKNGFFEMLRHPAKLILYLVVGGLILFSGLVNMLDADPAAQAADLSVLKAIYLAALLLISYIQLFQGLHSGATFFTMSDVALLFVAPISPKKILVYGLCKQMGTVVLMAFFLLAYGGMAVNYFAISPLQGVGLLLGFAILCFIMQLLTLVLYSYANGNDKRIRAIRAVLYLILGAVAVAMAVPVVQQGFSMANVLAAADSPWLEMIPFIGWMKGALFGWIDGDVGRALLFLALLLAGTGAALWLFLRSNADYYEDVLQNTETTFAMRQAMKEGRVAASTVNTRAPKVKDTGLGGGWGANAFFYKQVRELKRQSPFFLLNKTTLMAVVVCVFMAFLMTRTDGEDTMSANLVMMICTIVAVYFLLFINAAGEWGKEIMKPYLYLVPEPPLRKLIWASMTSLLKPLVDGAVIFVATGLFLQAKVTTMAVCALIYASFGVIFTASNLLSQRVLGTMANKGLMLVLYMLLLLLIVAPGVAIGVALYLTLHIPAVAMGVPVILWNLAVGLGIYVLCKNTLHDMEVL